uniref:Sensory neuron membrane protein 2-1 n=1 Tax=Cyrtorhinus lividipennis TaxID=1032904 RepID=A0A346TI35_9HEMI|nr:sensory neuron membrane protein 2-1 [Cyrtorhinus lividipennis]
MGSISGNKILYLAGFGAVLFFLGVFFGCAGIDLLINYQIKKSLVLEEGSPGLATFKKTPFPLEFKIYLFNITNPEEIMNGGKPVVAEVGPYVYDLWKEKPDLVFLPDGTLEYNLTSRLFFNQEKSGNLRTTDVFLALNIPLLGTATTVEQTFPMGLVFLNNAIPFLFPNITDIFMTATVGEILFDGVTIKCNYSSGPAMPICNGLKGRAPATMWRLDTKDYKFALFRPKNTSVEGPFKVLSGRDDISQVGRIIEYKNKNKLTAWDKNSSCATIDGTDSTIFGPQKTPHEEIQMFSPDLCLTFKTTYINSSTINKVPVDLFYAAESNMASSQKEPANECRCVKDDDGIKHCLKDGVIDASPCQGAQVIFSNPHFLDADPEYQNGVDGLKPDATKHTTFVYQEPKTGAPLEGRKRMQMSLKVKKIEGITILENITERLIPILWIEEGTRLEGPLLGELHQLYHIIGLLETLKWLLMAAGLLIVAIAIVLYLKVRGLACFSGTMLVTPVDNVPGQKMNTFGVTNQGSDDYEGGPNFGIYPKLAASQNKNGDIVSPTSHPQQIR